MGTYTKIVLKNKKNAKKVNDILKQEYEITYETIVKISCPCQEHLKEIKVLQKFLTTEYAKEYIDYKNSKHIEELIAFNVERHKENF